MRVWSLVKGVIELSHMFQKHISNLMIELRELNESIRKKKLKPKSTIPTIQMSFIHQRVHWKTDLQSMQLLLQHHFRSIDLQLSSMAPLLSKTSNQCFFLRILKLLTQVRDTIRQLTRPENVPWNELLDFDSLWKKQSKCLKELEETQDNHAVLVLQSAVEAFLIVHSTLQIKKFTQCCRWNSFTTIASSSSH